MNIELFDKIKDCWMRVLCHMLNHKPKSLRGPSGRFMADRISIELFSFLMKRIHNIVVDTAPDGEKYDYTILYDGRKHRFSNKIGYHSRIFQRQYKRSKNRLTKRPSIQLINTQGEANIENINTLLNEIDYLCVCQGQDKGEKGSYQNDTRLDRISGNGNTIQQYYYANRNNHPLNKSYRLVLENYNANAHSQELEFFDWLKEKNIIYAYTSMFHTKDFVCLKVEYILTLSLHSWNEAERRSKNSNRNSTYCS